MSDNGDYRSYGNHEIEELLNQARPDVYDPSDKKWMEDVVAIVAASIPTQEARFIAAEQRVYRVETAQTRRINHLLRLIARSGQLPIDFLDTRRWPVAVSSTERRCVGKMADDSWDTWANNRRREAFRNMTKVNEACEGAEWIANQIRSQGLTLTEDLDPAMFAASAEDVALDALDALDEFDDPVA